MKFPFGITPFATRAWFANLTIRILGIYPYFSFHYIFARSSNRHAEFARIWEETPKLAADVPRRLKHGYKQGLSAEKVLEFIESSQASMHKLLWQINLDEPYWRSVIAGLEIKKPEHILEIDQKC